MKVHFLYFEMVSNYNQVFLYSSSLKPNVILSPNIAKGLFTNMPSEASNSKRSSSDKSSNLFLNLIHDIWHRVY